MANKARHYTVSWCWKTDPKGNRSTDVQTHVVDATTVTRAISKTVKDIEDGKWEGDFPDHLEEFLGEDGEVRAADLLVIEVTITRR